MPKYRLSGGLFTPAESWRVIRTLRSEPPADVCILPPARRAVFQTGLEQAQQQFAAAETVGYESRPLNLFYGLSQAGRAIVAATPATRRSDEGRSIWQGRGHGLEYEPGSMTVGKFFTSKVALSPTERDLYSLVSEAVQSPTDFHDISLGALLSQLPEFVLDFGPQAGCLPVLFIDGIPREQFTMVNRVGWQVALPSLPDSSWWTEEQVNSTIHGYPALLPMESDPQQDGNARLGNSGYTRLVAPIDAFSFDTRRQLYFPKKTSDYRGLKLIFPATGTGTQPLHPLMAWWLTLYALSMLARYAPESWTKIMTISSSPIASRIELVLDAALDAVPQLLGEALLRI